MTTRFDNIAVSVSDVEASAAWYGKLFGFTVGYRTFLEGLQADFLVLLRDDIRIELISQKGVARHEDADIQPPNHLAKTNIIAIVFSTDDLDTATAEMEREGAAFVWKNQVLSADGLRSTMLRDPDGNMINVLCYPKAA
jgi:catechol 2,3-dioxygenase-like lactoylglutathione lyase family enzyme